MFLPAVPTIFRPSLVIGFACLTCAAGSPGQLVPQFNQCTLELNGHTLKPREVRPNWSPQFDVGPRRLVVRGDRIEELGPNGQTTGSTKSPDGWELNWMACDGKTAYLRAHRRHEDKHEIEYESPPQLRRLNIAESKWDTPLLLPSEKKKPEERDAVIAALCDRERLVVLTERTITADRDTEAVSHSLSFFRIGKDQAEWSQKLPSNGRRPAPGVYLWASVMPDYADADIRYLSWLGDGVLVCAGEKDDLIHFDRAGKVAWKVPRIWEYQRGFTGPSVWSHHISRFGTDHLEERAAEGLVEGNQEYLDKARKRFETARQKFNEQFECAIVGGPAIVPGTSDDRNRGPRIFVAVARGPRDWNWGYLSGSVIYELTDEGEFTAMTTVPRMVDGGRFSVLADGLVWACQHGAMVKIRMQGPHHGPGIGPGSSDLLCDIDWYRQYLAPDVKAWLKADKATDLAAFIGGRAFRTVAGGYVLDQHDHTWRFPITYVDLATGLQGTATLAVPFRGDVPMPKTNFSGDGAAISVRGPYLLAVTHLDVRQEGLELVVGGKDTATGVTFDVALAPPPKG